jgi:hypothetical protein
MIDGMRLYIVVVVVVVGVWFVAVVTIAFPSAVAMLETLLAPGVVTVDPELPERLVKRTPPLPEALPPVVFSTEVPGVVGIVTTGIVPRVDVVVVLLVPVPPWSALMTLVRFELSPDPVVAPIVRLVITTVPTVAIPTGLP